MIWLVLGTGTLIAAVGAFSRIIAPALIFGVALSLLLMVWYFPDPAPYLTVLSATACMTGGYITRLIARDFWGMRENFRLTSFLRAIVFTAIQVIPIIAFVWAVFWGKAVMENKIAYGCEAANFSKTSFYGILSSDQTKPIFYGRAEEPIPGSDKKTFYFMDFVPKK